MKQENRKPAEVISFLSGKGGSGKTTAALSIAKVLADVGFNILLVDFDLSTSGASYFFLPRINERTNKGLAEILDECKAAEPSLKAFSGGLFKSLILSVDTFDFIPSRAGLGKKFGSNEALTKEFFISDVLRPLIQTVEGDYDYILIDNQAGYSSNSAAAARVATKAIIVAESDRISSDAVDNLIALIGEDMPRFRRYLINKVEIKEAGDYHSKAKAFSEMNRLPPLPFDFSIRNAFGEREIPVNVEKPSSFLIALFATIKEILPEKRTDLEKYENEKITKLFDEYQGQIDSLLARRTNLQGRLIEVETFEQRRDAQLRIFNTRIALLTALVATFLSVAYISFPFFSLRQYVAYLVVVLTLTLSVVLFYRTRIIGEAEISRVKRATEQLEIQHELASIQADIDQYKNLVATRSRELLIDQRVPYS